MDGSGARTTAKRGPAGPWSLGLALVLVLCASSQEADAAGAEARAERIVSLNLCADELVLRLAGPERVASVSFLSQDPAFSPLADLAATRPANRGLAEEVVMQRPDLVVAGAFTTRSAVEYLEREGYPVIELGSPTSLSAAREQVQDLAARLGVPERGAALAATIPASPEAERTGEAGRPSAVVLAPNGFAAGAGSIVDELIRLAGLRNLGAELRTGGYGAVSLERLVLSGVDVLVVDEDEGGGPSLATALLHHPALERLGRRIEVVSIPSRLWTCPGPQLADALARLRAAAGELR